MSDEEAELCESHNKRRQNRRFIGPLGLGSRAARSPAGERATVRRTPRPAAGTAPTTLIGGIPRPAPAASAGPPPAAAGNHPGNAQKGITVKAKRIIATLGLACGAYGLTAAPAAAAAAPLVLYASPSGSGSACTAARPCSPAGAAAQVAAKAPGMSADIDVDLAGGTYRLAPALQLGPQDSGRNGHDVVWQAVPGQVPVFSGAVQVTGFTSYDAALDIWRAPVPAAAAASGGQQLFVDGRRAQLARTAGTPVGLAVTATGFTTADSSYASFTGQSRIEAVNESDWKHESCPVTAVSALPGGGSAITMLPSCWSANNTSVPNLGFPFNGAGLPAMSSISYLENAYQLLTQPGQFYLDQSADYLYYIPAPGQNMATADVELPVQQSLLTLQGTPGHLAPVNQDAAGAAYAGSGWSANTDRSYGDLDNDVEDSQVNGASVSYTFSGTGLEVLAETYNDEGTFNAYVDGTQDTSKSWTENDSGSTRLAQQVVYSVQGLPQGTHTVKLVKTGGTYLTIDGFEATPNVVNPVKNNVFQGITFTGTTWNTPENIGYLDNQAGVLWNTTTSPVTPVIVPAAVTVSRGDGVTFSGDTFDHLGATALAFADGTQNSTVTDSTITDIAGGGVSVGEVDDYYQNDAALMTSGDTISDNEISFVGQNYSDDVGVWAGFTKTLTVTHNDIGYTPYSGMSLGWGWGWQSDCTLQADQGLSSCRHGTSYAGGNQITDNYIHDVMNVLYDGGPIYTNGGQGYGTGVSTGPCQQTSTLSGNVVAAGAEISNMLYQDEGSSCWNTFDNVAQYATNWIGMWTPTINTINIHDNYSDNASYYNNGTNITFNQATIVTGGAWPAPAQAIIAAAGVPVQDVPLTGRIDDENLAVQYTGSWSDSTHRSYGDFDGGVHYTQADGSSASLTFTGTGVQVLGETNSDQGDDEIYLDGVDKGSVNTDTATRSAQQAIYSVSGLTPGTHTVQIVKTSGTYTTIDGFNITSTVNDTDPAITYTGSSWSARSNHSSDGDYDDNIHIGTCDGDQATVTFYGTGITYYAETNSDGGTIGVTLDGIKKASVSAHSATRRTQQAVYSVSGLPVGVHTLTLTKQSGAYLSVDRFDVH